MDKRIISIEGNIGSGKSFLLEKLKKKLSDRLDVLFIDEPLSEWLSIKDNNNKNLLEYFYEDKQKYSMTMQVTTIITRFNSFRKAINNPNIKIIISERSIESDFRVFGTALYNSGFINEIEWKAYCNWVNTFRSMLPKNEYIYLTTDIDTCMNRIKERGRKGEENITLELMKSYNDCHDNWLKDNSFKSCVTFLKDNEDISIETLLENLNFFKNKSIFLNSYSYFSAIKEIGNYCIPPIQYKSEFYKDSDKD